MEDTFLRKPHERCGKKAKSTNKPCKRPAGWGTDHKGEGACKLHGGATPIKHGLYSKYLRGETKRKYEEFLKADNIKDLSHEIARLRAVLANIDEHDLFKGDPKYVYLLLSVIEAIGKMVERKHKIETNQPLIINNSFALSVLSIVKEEVTDTEIVERIAERVESLSPDTLRELTQRPEVNIIIQEEMENI